MTGGDTNISDRWAAEYYLPQFEKAIQVGGVREIMTAHVAVNGVLLRPMNSRPLMSLHWNSVLLFER